MADNPNLPVEGVPVRADDIAGVLHPAVKITIGADGVDNGFVSTANPLPVEVVSGGDGSVQGVDAHDAAITADPVLMGAEARASDRAAVAEGDAVRLAATLSGKLVVLPGAVPANQAQGTLNRTTNSAGDVIAAAGSGVRIAVMSVTVTNKHATVGTTVSIRDGTTAKITNYAAPAGGGFHMNGGGFPLFVTAANAAVTAICGTTGSDIDITITGYKTTDT